MLYIKYSKKRIVSTLFLGLIAFSLFINLFSIKGQGQASNITYDLNKELFYNSTGFDYDNSFNLENISTYTEHYNATYSFENETDGTTDIDFIDTVSSDDTNPEAIIINNNDGHDKVIKFSTDGNNGKLSQWKHNINQDIGTIEYWVKYIDYGIGINYMYLFNEGNQAVVYTWFSHTGNDFNVRYGDGLGGTGVITVDTPATADIWYHVKVLFNCTSDTHSVWFNNILLVDNESFYINEVATSISTFTYRLIAGGGLNNLEGWLDAFGESWDTFNTGFFFDVSGECTEPTGISWDGTSFWVLDSTDVYKYNNIGIYQAETHDISSEVSDAFGITWDGTYFWVVGYDNQEIYKYDNSWVYQNEFIDCSSQDSDILGITWDGTYLWVSGLNTEAIYKYNTEGVYQNEFFDTSKQGSPSDITWDGTFFWIADGIALELYQYNSLGIYTGVYFDTLVLDAWGTWLDSDGTYLWYVGSNNLEVYRLQYKLEYYYVGKNLIPYSITNTSFSQIRAYEFCFENIDDKHEIGELNPESWGTFTTGLGSSAIFYDYSSILPTGTFYQDRVVRMNNTDVSTTELSKNNLGINSEFINITFGLNISAYDLNTDMIYIQTDGISFDLLDLRIYKTGGNIILTYFDGGHTLIYEGLNLTNIYDFNILLDLEIDQAFITLNENSIQIGYFQIPLLNLNEVELDVIIFYILSTLGNTIIMDVDYCGIFNNGITAVEYDTSYGYIQIKFNTNWNFKYYNLYSLQGIGLLQSYNFISADNIIYPSEAADDIVDTFREFTNNTRVSNIYDIPQLFGANISGYHDLIIYTKQNITYDFINIEGVSLSEGSNKHWLKQTHSGVDINESYFYVDSNERLQFSHLANDTNLEYIQAEFNINDISSDDFAVRFESAINNIAYGFFRVKFTDISNYIPIEHQKSTTRFFLSQGKTISSFIILITDDDINTVIGNTIGYISNIKLLYVAGVSVSFLTFNLLTMMIPIILIFIPTFLLSSRIGKNSIVPLMMLMSLVCTITLIIPYWLFFVIIFPSSLFLFLKRSEGVL